MFNSAKLLIRRFVPASLIPMLRPVPYYLLEPFQPRPKAQNDIPVPPLWKMFEGPRDKELFLRNGQEALEIYREYGHLRPGSHMLDIGSGLGRKTRSLVDFLAPEGRYVGVDIVREGVDWCNKVISSNHPNFVFLHLNVYNAMYNRHATVKALDYHFPFVDDSFDLITAWSVFTHMLPADIDNYLSEMRRMVKPDGRCIFSFFMMTERAISAVSRKTAKEKIEYEIDGWYTNNKNLPEDVIAFKEDWIRSACERAGLLVEEILHGGWTGYEQDKRFPILNHQDIVIARAR